MNEAGRFRHANSRSGVLVLTLLVLVLVSVVVLGLLASVTVERQITESSYQQRRALSVAMLGFQSGVSQLRSALGTGTNSWDNPYANFATNSPTFFWSVSPGRLTRWSYTSSIPQSNIALFSIANTTITNTVNLNRPLADGTYPIIGLSDVNAGQTTPPAVSVQFVNVLQNPLLPATKGNPIIGRYAFWIDDESAKININVADGTQKYTTNSLGVGSPTEVSLQVLSQAGSALTPAVAGNIVQMARTNTYHSPREILRVTGTTPDLYSNNVFDLTDFSRSPDLNIFGQPKMAIMPVLGDPNQFGYKTIINSLTLRPECEIYPTTRQLVPFYVANSFSGWNTPAAWPIAFRAEGEYNNQGRAFTPSDVERYAGNLAQDCPSYNHEPDYFPYNNGRYIANYMSGINGSYHAIQWPPFPGSPAPAAGFLGKYTPRQIDEIAMEIITLGSKLISSDYPYPQSGDYPTNNIWWDPSTHQGPNGGGDMFQTGLIGSRFQTVPFIFPGWLSNQWVIGLGRTPITTRVAMTTTAYSSSGLSSNPSDFTNEGLYIPPYALMTVSIEQWIPASYRSGYSTLRYQGPQGFFGINDARYCINSEDMEQSASTMPWAPLIPPDTNQNDYTHHEFPPAMLPAADGSRTNFWANRLLTNDQGIDFSDNLYSYPDPDQYHASNIINGHGAWNQPHTTTDYGTVTTTNAQGQISPVPYIVTNSYPGAGDAGAEYNIAVDEGVPSTSPFNFTSIWLNYAGGDPPDTQEWGSANNTNYPGEMRTMQSQVPATRLYMSSAADGEHLHIGGGIQIRNSINNFFSESDPVPLESIRGGVGDWINDLIYDTNWNESFPGNEPGSPSGATSRDRNTNSLIPIYLDLSIPAHSVIGEGTIATNYIAVQDPLVNKFPGDWVTNALVPSDFAVGSFNPHSYLNHSEQPYLTEMRNSNGDPDSYWLPQMDCAVSSNADIARQTLIPRSARMPSVGYLQYIRTGIIPDDESVPYSQQHGTPFRLLSFGPSGDSSQGVHSVNYPDWALLDLFYVPSIIDSFGGPYATLTNLVSFGTYGGATAGRINPNGSVIYTTNTSVPQPDVSRILPLAATLKGLYVNQTIQENNDPTAWPYTGGSAVDAANVAQAIADYIRQNGPLRMPAEICNISTVSNLRASENVLGTRNDLVRQMVGELTTQSNVFSVWTVGQIVQKVPGHLNYGEFETGDQVLGEVRLHFIVERYLDQGSDGVYGNSNQPGDDNAVGSFDDTNSVYHPFEPKYLYRVVRSEEVR